MAITFKPDFKGGPSPASPAAKKQGPELMLPVPALALARPAGCPEQVSRQLWPQKTDCQYCTVGAPT